MAKEKETKEGKVSEPTLLKVRVHYETPYANKAKTTVGLLNSLGKAESPYVIILTPKDEGDDGKEIVSRRWIPWAGVIQIDQIGREKPPKKEEDTK